MISFKQEGHFNNTRQFLKSAQNINVDETIHRIASLGVRALSSATPVKTGLTAASWDYEIKKQNGKIIVNFLNNNVVKGVNIAIILQQGHGTKNGGYVQGRDYINPALRPIFDNMEEAMWKAVVSK